ncbi:YggS family pyridoxal phosphate-dependent enzyme [Desulfotruncus alcoholivorax]|uniref:YggS family pyridoxal phosphate-dependent enzyme n=1 Tax=Desulfotruncus alcoholivorax TaxID=265477 RepID=UPI00283AADE8|nr:YggS family pyridoxal phosphate-dependent enzyme [Desulfotruncus alcoholivorax]
MRENLINIRERVRLAAFRAGRDPQTIKIIAVTKRVDVPRIMEAVAAGVTDLGENRVQELSAKVDKIPSSLHWHLIGHLQTNKVKHVLGKVELIHSLDSWNLAVELDRQAARMEIIPRVLVQVNVSGEETKYGINPGEAYDFITELKNLGHIKVEGLMTIAPFVDNPQEARPFFRELRLLSRELNEKISGVELKHLSMGMTNDYEVAVEEGSDMLRLGTAIFGARIDQ